MKDFCNINFKTKFLYLILRKCINIEGRNLMLVSRCLRSFHTATTKVGSEANVCSLSSTDSNPRFKTSPKPILDTATLNVIGSCGKFVVSTNENGLGLWKRETGTSTEWSQRLEVYSRQVMEIFQKSAKTESKLNKKQPCLTHKIFFVSHGARLLSRLLYFIHWRTVDYHCIRGNNCFFSLGIPFTRTDRAHFLVVLFLSNLTRLIDVALATTSEVPVPFLIGQSKSECLRIQTNVCEDLPETALVPLTAL